MTLTKLRRLRKLIAAHYQLYFFLLLPLAYLVIFNYTPMFGVQLAFRKFTIRQGIWNSPWVGIENFVKFFTSYMFPRVMKNTITLSVYGLLAGFPLPIIFALGLNTLRNQRYKKTVQLVTYAPHFISTTVLVGMLMAVLNPRNGIYAAVSQLLFKKYPNDLFGSAEAFSHLYVWSGIWQSLGWNAIIYVAALSTVDMELHEAAQIDGASRLQRLYHIDFMCILPTASILLILSAGSIMSIGFEKAFLMQNTINQSSSEVISTYVYKVGLTGSTDYSYSTAIGLFNSVVNMCMLLLVNFITGRLSRTSLF